MNVNFVIIIGYFDFLEDMFYGKYLLNEIGVLYYCEGFII